MWVWGVAERSSPGLPLVCVNLDAWRSCIVGGCAGWLEIQRGLLRVS